MMSNNQRLDDQGPLNVLLDSFDIKIKGLPNVFFNPGLNLLIKSGEYKNDYKELCKRCLWQLGDEVKVPADVILHHANWTIGMDNKIKQLEYVKSLVSF